MLAEARTEPRLAVVGGPIDDNCLVSSVYPLDGVVGTLAHCARAPMPFPPCNQKLNFIDRKYRGLVIECTQFVSVGKYITRQGDAGSDLCCFTGTHRIRKAVLCHNSSCTENLADFDRT